MGSQWNVVFDPALRPWLDGLSQGEYARVVAALEHLQMVGPALGRPLVDSIAGSQHSNMKELRVGTTRLLFAFDHRRNAVMLAAGDKRGRWSSWYATAVPLADQRFTQWLDLSLEEK